MHQSITNLNNIISLIKTNQEKKNNNNKIKIIAVSKTFKIDKILPLIDHGHIDFGENKVQEAIEKWSEIKKNNTAIKLHMIGKLQTNKVKFAVKLFDYIHSLDSMTRDEIVARLSQLQKQYPQVFIEGNFKKVEDDDRKKSLDKS